jgi:hypothetical protein
MTAILFTEQATDMTCYSNAAANAANSVGNTLNQAAEWATGRTEEAQKEAGKEAVKSDNTTLGQKFDGAKDYVEHGAKEQKHDAKKNYYDNKEDARSATS